MSFDFPIADLPKGIIIRILLSAKRAAELLFCFLVSLHVSGFQIAQIFFKQSVKSGWVQQVRNVWIDHLCVVFWFNKALILHWLDIRASRNHGAACEVYLVLQ